MNDWIVFIKLNFALILMFFALLSVSIIFGVLLKKYPEKLGLSKPINKNLFWLTLIPMVIFVGMVIRDKVEGLTDPTHVDLHGNIVFVKGLIETIRERPEDGVAVSEFQSKLFMYNKATGKQITSSTALEALYVSDNKLLCAGAFGYPVVDLTTGEVLEIISEDQIKEKVAKYTPEKIFSLEPDAQEACFSIRTVLDKKLLYDPVQDVINPEDGRRLFTTETRPAPIQSEKLFQPQAVGVSPGGLMIAHSYEDLEKKSFFLSALNSKGEIIWSKRDAEISPELKGELFTNDAIKNNTVMDDQNLYFINKRHLVCLSLATGNLVWIISI